MCGFVKSSARVSDNSQVDAEHVIRTRDYRGRAVTNFQRRDKISSREAATNNDIGWRIYHFTRQLAEPELTIFIQSYCLTSYSPGNRCLSLFSRKNSVGQPCLRQERPTLLYILIARRPQTNDIGWRILSSPADWPNPSNGFYTILFPDNLLIWK